MTTIAWDGATIAADTQCTSSIGLVRRTSKVFKLPTKDDTLIFCGCGQVSDTYLIKAWLEDGMTPHRRPELEDPKGSNGMLYFVKTKRMYLIETPSLVLLPILEGFWAVGSGRDFALAAMYHGHTAEQAVLTAHKFDAWTGGDVEVIKLP